MNSLVKIKIHLTYTHKTCNSVMFLDRTMIQSKLLSLFPLSTLASCTHTWCQLLSHWIITVFKVIILNNYTQKGAK